MKFETKTVLFCYCLSFITVAPLCYILWRVSNSIYELEIPSLITTLEKVAIEMGNLDTINDSLLKIKESFNTEQLNTIMYKLNTTLDHLLSLQFNIPLQQSGNTPIPTFPLP